MPGNRYTLFQTQKNNFELVKKYDQVKVTSPYGENVLTEPENARLAELKVKNGTRVEKGDVIAVLQAEEGVSQLAGYERELVQLKSSFEYQRMLDTKEAAKKQKRLEEMRLNQTDGTCVPTGNGGVTKQN